MSIWSWLRRRRLALDEDDFAEEIRAHLAMAERNRIEDGADPAGAHFAARREFGNLTLTTEAARREWTPRWAEALLDSVRDVRYAIRSLARTPAFSFLVIGVLTLGITLDATVFTLLKGLALTPLAGVERSAQLRVVLRETDGGPPLRLSYPDFEFLREHDRAFHGLMGTMFKIEHYRLGKGEGSRTASVEFVTGNYFDVLGVTAAAGRTLLPSDEIAPGANPVVVLSHSLWQRDYGSDPGIVGRTLEVNRYPLTVVGIAAAGFHGTVPLYDVEVFIPITMAADVGVVNVAGVTPGASQPHLLSDPDAALLAAHGFLRPGVTPAAAAEQTATLWDERARLPSALETQQRLTIFPFWRSPVGPQTYMLPMFGTLIAMGSLVLLIACANIAGLVLARGVSRRGEIAARLALGASRWRIVRLLTIETLVLVVPATALGVLLAQHAAGALLDYVGALGAPQRFFFNIQVDAFTVGFAALVAALCALVFGVVPAVQTSRVDLTSALNEDASPRGAARGRLRAALVTTQVAVSLVLMIGAALVMRSLGEAARIDPGYDDTGVMMFEFDLQQTGYDEARGRVFYRNLLDALNGDDEIESASLALAPPLTFLEPPAERYGIDGYAPARGEQLRAPFNVVTPGYFRSLGIGLVAGREFDSRDTGTGRPVAIVNYTLAERFWGGADAAIGKRIRSGGDDWRTVVGVAKDVKYVRIDEGPRPYFYVPLDQAYRPSILLHTRGRAGDAGLIERTRAHVAALDPDLPPPRVQPLSNVRRVSLILLQITAAMLFVFGASGMTLTAMGTYGLVSYTVLQHTREIGIRMALGATSLAVVHVFVGRGLRLGATGAIIGIIVALAGVRLISNRLFGLSAMDWPSFTLALVIVVGSVLLAALVPAWRASRTSPVTAMRHL